MSGGLDSYIADVVAGRREAYPRKGIPTTGVEAVPQHVFEQWARTQRAVVDTAAKLGLNPADRARLFKDTGWARHLAGDFRESPALLSLVAKGRALRRGPGEPGGQKAG